MPTANAKTKPKTRATRNRQSLTTEAVSFRPTARVRRCIDEGAKRSNRTVSGEINYLVERALEIEDRVIEDFRRAFGGASAYTLGYLAARAAAGVEGECGVDWTSDATARSEVALALRRLADVIESRRVAIAQGEPDVLVSTTDGKTIAIQCKSKHAADRVLASMVGQLAKGDEIRLFWPLVVATGNNDRDEKAVPPIGQITAILVGPTATAKKNDR